MSQHSIRRGSVGRRSRSCSSSRRLLDVVGLPLLLGERVAALSFAIASRSTRGPRCGRAAATLCRGARRATRRCPRRLPAGAADDLVRDELRGLRGLAVVLREEARRPSPRPGSPPRARTERVLRRGPRARGAEHLDEAPLAVEADDVAVDVVDGDDALLLAHLLDGAELVAVHGRELEAHAAAASFIRSSSSRESSSCRPSRNFATARPARRTSLSTRDARRRAALDLVLEARPPPVASSTSLQVRSWKCLLTRWSVRRALVAEW